MHMHKFEKIWLIFGVGSLILFLTTIGVSAFYMGHHPPSSHTTINPEKVDVTPPFNNPGVKKLNDNEYEVVLVASAFSYVPNQIQVPTNAKIHFKVATKDVIHGFEIAGTNVNMMVEPGYVSEFTQTFRKPGEFLILCNEYCGIGHHMMTSKIEVVEQ
ncbi:cytochrome c oxidase subunit II [Metabacillus iocasae]|uniref:Cytochrome aa3 subunit 2 n=1 Tax=Priestia iocasae TaxID=2291674 RepID=A0ABS2QXR1_9BACI|nr:cytochrome c oxidase subunit II [Metabacillus iocasae]MBM7703264.1 cytochrome c oxidase subunit 2 [Metabacillus iocasae]